MHNLEAKEDLRSRDGYCTVIKNYEISETAYQTHSQILLKSLIIDTVRLQIHGCCNLTFVVFYTILNIFLVLLI